MAKTTEDTTKKKTNIHIVAIFAIYTNRIIWQGK
jgi:hypothetical protein